jgi:hypothetical protein
MKKETFNKVVELKQKLDSFNEVKSMLRGMANHRLTYVELDSRGAWSSMSGVRLIPIVDILDRHDEQIRKEIDEEIQKIQKEIEEL